MLKNSTAVPDETLQLSDADLIANYLAGDVSGFDELFRRHHHRVRATCALMVGDSALAEDLVQETFLHVLRSLTRIDQSFNVAAWINRIAVNAARDELRRRARRSGHIHNGDPETDLLRVADTDREGDPEKAFELSNLRKLIWQVAQQLPERQQMALALRELQGLSYAAIGRVMGLSEPAVETLLFRARKRFREEFMQLENPDESSGL